METLLAIHGGSRWFIALLAIIVIIKLLINVVQRKDFATTDGMLLRLYTISLTIQFTLGIILLINVGNEMNWGMSSMRSQLEHVVTMLLAVTLAHATAAFKSTPADKRSAKTLRFIIYSLLLIILGVARLKGIEFWWGS